MESHTNTSQMVEMNFFFGKNYAFPREKKDCMARLHRWQQMDNSYNEVK